MPLRRKSDLVYVNARIRPNGQTIHYGFHTNIPSAERTILGHQDAKGAGAGQVYLEANIPQPPRYRKQMLTGTVSSFCSSNAIGNARNDGYRQSKPAKYLTPLETDLMVRVGVNLGNGIHYCWNMYLEDFNSHGAALGIERVTNTTNGVMGTSNPRPPRAFRVVAGAEETGTRTQSSFYDRNAGLPTGWRSEDNGVQLTPP